MHRNLSLNVSSGFESLERRQLMAADVRSVDGSGNNLAHGDWGATGQSYLRLALAAYADGKSAPAGSTRASARGISNALMAQVGDLLSSTHLSSFAYVWGQFIDHDLDLTNTGTESFNIAVPTGDPYFDPTGTGTQVINLSRSLSAAGTGVTNSRQQKNEITAYIDGSMVYGSDSATASSLRTFVGGKLKSGDGSLLPDGDGGFFVAGDVRANENIELIAIQTLFLREHNRLAGEIASKNPSWNDERIYQQARKLVIAEIQNITYTEFLPALLGGNGVAPYRGYRADVNPGISNEFATAAFRLGHSMLADDVEFINDDGSESRDAINLADAFFNPSIVRETGIDVLMKYIMSSNSQNIDLKLVDSVRNFLFGQPGAGGFDLASLNIQRGRDHGLADYNTTRVALGLPRVTSFAQISSDPQVQAPLKAVYGSVDNIDLWVGGLAEDHVAGGAVGETFRRIVADQFTRTRDGDRFWYEATLNREEMAFVRSSSLSQIVRRNTTLRNLQADAFRFDVRISGRIFDDANRNGRFDSRENPLAGRFVGLYDDAGDLVDSTTSLADGSYVFSFVQIGEYVVRAVASTGWLSTTAAASIDVTRGQMFANVDLGQAGINPLTPPPPTNPLPPRNRVATTVLM